MNWNGWHDTLECVRSVLGAQRLPTQIVICDNGSMDGSVQHLAEAFARDGVPCAVFPSPAALLRSQQPPKLVALVEIGENLGYAGGNNVGLRYALARCDADYVWILNNDVVVAEDALAAMLALVQSDPKIGLTGARLLRHDDRETVQAMGGGFIVPVICHDTQLGQGQPSSAFSDEPIAVDHLVGACLLARADAVRSTGLIDESYFLYREETDWCIRMRREGWKVVCCAAARVWHKQSRSVGFHSPLHDYYAVRNMLRLVRKEFPAALPFAFCYFVLRSIVPKLVRFEGARARAVVEAVRDFLTGVSGRARAHTDEVLFDQYLARRKDLVESASNALRRESGDASRSAGSQPLP